MISLVHAVSICLFFLKVISISDSNTKLIIKHYSIKKSDFYKPLSSTMIHSTKHFILLNTIIYLLLHLTHLNKPLITHISTCNHHILPYPSDQIPSYIASYHFHLISYYHNYSFIKSHPLFSYHQTLHSRRSNHPYVPL